MAAPVSVPASSLNDSTGMSRTWPHSGFMQRHIDDARLAGKRVTDIPVDDEDLQAGHRTEHVPYKTAVQVDDKLGLVHLASPRNEKRPADDP